MNEQTTPLYYAAWWRRLVAFIIDMLVLFPLLFLQFRISSTSPQLYAILLIPFSVIFLGYWVVCHGRWGKTLGKLITGTTVTKLDGTSISWSQAFLRSSVEIGLSALASIALISAYLDMPVEGYTYLSMQDRTNLLKASWPQWYPIVNTTQDIWIWSEFIIILLNKRRRALHDFIASTIVVQNKPTRRQIKESNSYGIDFDKEMKRLQKQRL